MHSLTLHVVSHAATARMQVRVGNGNQHDSGVQILQRVALERGHACLAVHPGLPDDELLRLASELHPRLLGISISMSEMTPRGLPVLRTIDDFITALDQIVRRAPARLGKDVGASCRRMAGSTKA